MLDYLRHDACDSPQPLHKQGQLTELIHIWLQRPLSSAASPSSLPCHSCCGVACAQESETEHIHRPLDTVTMPGSEVDPELHAGIHT